MRSECTGGFKDYYSNPGGNLLKKLPKLKYWHPALQRYY